MIGIRCDANSIIASGHMMRCLTIAKELVRLGESVTFFVADKESEAAFKSMASAIAGVDAAVLSSNWQNMEEELPSLEKELSAREVSLLLVDSYSVTVPYFEKLSKLCPVAYIDDLHEDTYPVDMLINYSGYYKELGYEETYKDVTGFYRQATKLLLGLEYAPLREQFQSTKEDTELMDNAGGSVSILLASGGADAWGMLLGTLEAAEADGLIDDKQTWHVVAGALCRDADALDAFAASHPGVCIHRAVSDMAGLMRQCDLAICAGGTMLTECAAIELPAIFYQVADNQKYNADFFGSTGGMIFAGDVNGSKEAVIRNICGQTKALLTKEGELARMKSALKGMTDGCGAQRIAKELIETERKVK